MNYLFVTEGTKTEPNILEPILEGFGFNVIRKEKQNKYSEIDFSSIELSNGKNNVIIAAAPRNRLSHALLEYEKEHIDFHKLFGNGVLFNGIYIIYDVDHTSNENLLKAFEIHSDENDTGLLLVSCPCIEVLTDIDRSEKLRINESFKEYKKARNIELEKEYKCNCEQYIIKHFNEISLHYLEKNTKEFNETNVMRHPELVIEKINKENIRSNKECLFRYFTTVLYVSLAHMLGLTKQIDNYKIVKDFYKKAE